MSVEFVESELKRAAEFLGAIPGATERAAARALNKAATAGREAAIAAISERYAVQSADIRERITISTATPDKLGVTITSRSGSLSIGYFPHSPEESGTGGPGRPQLRAEVLRGKASAIGSAFISTINGTPRVMIRTGGTTKTGRTQIKSVYTVPFASMLGVSQVRDAIEQKAMAVLDAQLTKEIDRELGRAV